VNIQRFYPAFLLVLVISLSCFPACNNTKTPADKGTKAEKYLPESRTPVKQVKSNLLDTLTAGFKDADLVDVTLFSDEFILDIKYATPDNFLDTVLYPCAKCLLRYEVLKALLRAQSEFKSMGYKIKLFDCYRPHSIQVMMWEKFPIVGLVADPATGSRHNRGSAVDITLTDLEGKELDMGTEHDDMSKKGRTFYKDLPPEVIENRMLLRTVMEKNQFTGINSEWWHFSHICGPKYKVEDMPFPCDTLYK
jgi:D-alanyl-D-alanine dipeptidase